MRFTYIEKQPIYQTNEWKIIEKDFSEENKMNSESIFATANGYIGYRGTFEEGYQKNPDQTDVAMMLNGVYEYYELVPVPFRPGFVHKMHRIIGQINPLKIKIYIDEEQAVMSNDGYERVLDMQDGSMSRTFVYTTAKNKRAKIKFVRFASQYDRNIMCCRLFITVDCDAKVKVKTQLDNDLGKNFPNDTFEKLYSGIDYELSDNVYLATYKTKISQFTTTCAIKEKANLLNYSRNANQEGIFSEFNGVLHNGETFDYERIIGFACDKDTPNQKEYIIKKVEGSLSFEQYLQKNREDLDRFWDITNINIDSDDLVLQGVRFSMLQVYQSAGRDGLTNISANGLSGVVYQGHTFWDTEMYMLPLFTYGEQNIAKKLLTYRYSILDKARERAKQMEDKGALFAWCSINGEETSVYHEASTAQYHLDADIGYAIQMYFEASNDVNFIIDMGLEMLLELSKCLSHRGNFIPTKDNKFCINGVCGPDEYNPIVDNNLYTNLLTKRMFDFTLSMCELVKNENLLKYNELIKKCEMTDDEFNLIKRASDNMYIPYNDKYQIYMQDENFMYKDPYPVEDIPKEKLGLLGNLHPLNLWRYQVCKQADIVLATFIMSDYFSKEQIEKIFDYYEPKTVHDSSLSAAIHSIVACSIGRKKDAYSYLKQSARMDLDNVNGNTRYGLHAACMGGARMLIVNGYAGLRIYDNALHFEPSIYEKWKSYDFKINYKGNVIVVKVTNSETTYSIEKGEGIVVYHYGKQINVGTKKVVVKNG